jgi:hypothetical protein
MKTTTLQLLPTTTFGTPSGNYDGSSLDWSGDRQQAANYYGGFGSLQTIAFFLSSFNGEIEIQATLDSTPTQDSQWFRTYVFDTASSEVTTNFSTNITGNFTWMRARVHNFVNGSIEKVMMSY